jgi:hypothetical protein
MTYAEMLASAPELAAALDSQISAGKRRSAPDFERRSGLFTASELYKLFSPGYKVSESATARTYVVEKAYERLTGLPCRNEFSSAAVEWGKDNEAGAIEAYEAATGCTVSGKNGDQAFFKIPDFPAGATPDGLLDPSGTLEVKCPYNGANHFENLLCSDVDCFKFKRPEYFIQTQTAMWATGRDWCDFVSYDPRLPEHLRLYILRIPRDPDFIALLGEAVLQAERMLEDILRNFRQPTDGILA